MRLVRRLRMEVRNFKERYWRFSLFVLILGLGAAIFIELTPFLGGLLGAATIYVLLRGQMIRLTEHRKWRRSLAASLLMGEAVFFFLIPISPVVWMIVAKIQDVAVDPQSVIAPLKEVAELLRDRTGYDLWQESNLQPLIARIPRMGQWVVEGIVSFAVNIVVLLFLLYFMLIGGCRMERYFREILPFDRPVSSSLMHEVFWGGVTCFATVIPIVGTGLVWFPLAAYLALAGDWGRAIGLALYGLLIVTHVDNVVRFVLQKKLADTHPLVTVFGVFIGLSLFGFMGVIFGPLMLSIFIFCVGIFKKKFLHGAPDSQLFIPGESPRTEA